MPRLDKQEAHERLLSGIRAFKASAGTWPRSGRGSGGWRPEDVPLATTVGLCSTSKIYQVFGSLNAAWCAAEGAPVQTKMNYEDEAILAKARAFFARAGRFPRIGKNDNGPRFSWRTQDAALASELMMPSPDTYRRRFGNLGQAWAAATGLPLALVQAPGKKLTRDEMLDLLNVYKHHNGRYPISNSNTGWKDAALAKRFGLPHRQTLRVKFDHLPLADIFALAARRPLNPALLAA